MKTIAFHSYKGGVGRSLALSNLAIALSLIGKNVLILDWDFDAPGITIKFNVENKVEKGYVDYLVTFRKKYGKDIDKSDPEERKKYIKSCVINVDGTNIFLFPAGNTINKNYWFDVSSSYFQSYFYSDEEGEKGNIEFFNQDLVLLKSSLTEKEVDYLLIDCKTANAKAVIPLMMFGDKVVELFNCNSEGVFGELLVRSAIQNLNNQGFKKDVVLTSVMSRIPSHFTPQHALHEYKNIASSIHGFIDFDKDDLAKTLFVIHEQRELEVAELLILGNNKKNFLLSHDYIELFEEILKDDSEIQNKISSLGFKDWKTAIGLAEKVEFIERFFLLEVQKGNLFNEDNERNVALRCATLSDMLNGLVQDMKTYLRNAGMEGSKINENIIKSFEDAGFRAGQGFGLEAITPGRVWKQIPDQALVRIKGWLEFDRDAGFGKWTLKLDETQKSCIIILDNHFLSESEYGRFFLFGYIRGVLSYLIPGKDDPVSVVVKSFNNNEVTLEYV